MSDAQEQSRAIFFEGIEHFEAGRFEPARGCFERCLALTPGRPSVLGNLGITLFRLGQVQQSLPLLLAATAAQPDFSDAWACLGLAQEAQGQWALAADALQRALALSDASSLQWFTLGQCLARLGRQAPALSALDRALAIEPHFADAWSVRGSLLREMRRPDEAAQSFERAIALGADRALHEYYLASVRGGPAPQAAPRHYVEALFDDYAADYEGHLVDGLRYRAHEVLLQPLLERGRRWRQVLDLGCGTGLCGALLQSASDAIDGVDLSAAMLEKARATGVYRELVHADIGEHLAGMPSASVDLVVAGDVLNYVGQLSAVFESVARVLEPGGLFAFTVELSTNDQDLQLLPSLRYAHSERSVRGMAQQCGLAVEDLRQAPIRHEQGRPVAGLCVHLRRPGAAA